MSIHKPSVKSVIALSFVGALALSWTAFAGDLNEVKLPGDHAYPESITAAPDGTLYVSSPAVGGVWRVKPQSEIVEEWIKPGAFDTRSTLGVLVDKKANLVWVCSNDFSSAGIPGPSTVPGSYLKGFDLSSGEGKVSAELPGAATLCNDMVVGEDGSLYVTNSLAPQILRLKPRSTHRIAFKLSTARLESQDLRGERVGDVERAILANHHVVAQGSRSWEFRTHLALAGGKIEAFQVAAGDGAGARDTGRGKVIGTDPNKVSLLVDQSVERVSNAPGLIHSSTISD